MSINNSILFGWLLCAGVLAPFASADEPRDRVMRLVGDDVGVCIEVHGFAAHFAEWQSSPLVNRLRNWPVYQSWKRGREYAELRKVMRAVEKETKAPFDQVLNQLVGTSVVLTVTPRGVSDPPSVLFATYLENEDTARAVIAAWNRERNTNVETVSFAGGEYLRRTKNGSAEQHFYWLSNSLFAVANNEDLLKRTINRAGTADTTGSLRKSPAYTQCRKALWSDAWATFFLNPRAWDDQVQASGSPAERGLATAWKRLQAVGVAIRGDAGLTAEATVQFDSAQLPERWTKFLNRTAGTAGFLNRVPANALCVFAGRHDLSGVDKLITAAVPEQERNALRTMRMFARGLLAGRDVFADVLPALSPNWGMYVVPNTEQNTDAPANVVLAFEYQDSEKDGVTIREALDNGLHTGLNVLAASNDGMNVRTQEENGVTLRSVTGLGPYQPGFGLTDSDLVFSSSPEAIKQFLAKPAGRPLADAAPFTAWQQRFFPDDNQVFFLNMAEVTRFIGDQRAFFLKMSARKLSNDEANERLDRFIEGMGLIDAAFIAARAEEHGVHITAGLVTAESSE